MPCGCPPPQARHAPIYTYSIQAVELEWGEQAVLCAFIRRGGEYKGSGQSSVWGDRGEGDRGERQRKRETTDRKQVCGG